MRINPTVLLHNCARRAGLLLVISCFTVLVTGCGSSRDAASQQLYEVRSWTATTQLAQQQFRNGALPVVFTQGIARAAGRALTESQAAFDRMNLPLERQVHARSVLDSLARATRELSGVVPTR